MCLWVRHKQREIQIGHQRLDPNLDGGAHGTRAQPSKCALVGGHLEAREVGCSQGRPSDTTAKPSLLAASVPPVP